ncbi:MAG: YggT family protein [Acidobacteria bacterium]|jgi:YggT family protein|nr:YggT family protein [Thermoanaerobaculia bacterium]NLN12055.1 YggT family protein [Acidobacteriota bacterium]OQC42626.1 MAG: YGGT family protein [Acidobacteria bacterium ADurb.Bin051]MBP7813504.1 YggT family protein [Thermoanaerobaculia bacterium]MBP8844679.1 YggT family protein [Thermoanaerobaculia bacterium]
MGFARGFGFSLLQLVVGLLDLYTWVVVIRALLSWVGPDPYNPIVRLLHQLTEPLLAPLRRLVSPRRLGGLDLSPLLLILIIQFVRYGLIYAVTQPTRPF